MELTELIHNPEKDLLSFEPDLFIAASGYETRSIYIPNLCKGVSGFKTVLSFKEGLDELSRPENDKFFQSEDYQNFLTSANEVPDFTSLFKEIDKEEIKVVIDISVMTRNWYHSFLKFIHELEDYNKLHLRVVYCPAIAATPFKFTRKGNLKKYSMLDDEAEGKRNGKKSALILGLGRDKGACEHIFSDFSPDVSFLLFGDPEHDKEYVETVFVNNHSLIKQISIRNLKGYPTNNTNEIYNLLLDIVMPLREEYTVSIVPQGPKIFSLISMIFQFSYPDINIYFPEFKTKQVIDRKPHVDITSVDLKFEID